MTYHFVTETVTKLLEIRHRVAAVKYQKSERCLRTICWEIMRRTSSIIPYKKDNLSVYNIRKVCFASLLSFLKNKKHKATRSGRRKNSMARLSFAKPIGKCNNATWKKNKKKTETEPILRLGATTGSPSNKSQHVVKYGVKYPPKFN